MTGWNYDKGTLEGFLNCLIVVGSYINGNLNISNVIYHFVAKTRARGKRICQSVANLARKKFYSRKKSNRGWVLRTFEELFVFFLDYLAHFAVSRIVTKHKGCLGVYFHSSFFAE